MLSGIVRAVLAGRHGRQWYRGVSASPFRLRAHLCMTLPSYPAEETWVHLAVGLTNPVVVREMAHAEGRMYRPRPAQATGTTSHACRRDSFPPTQAVPLELLVLANRLHSLSLNPLDFVDLAFRPDFTQSSHDAGPTTDCVGPGFVLWFFLLGHGAHLIEIAVEDCSVWHVFGTFGELEKDDAGTNHEEAKYDVYDLGSGAVETLKEYGACDDRGRREVYVVGWCDQRRVEEIQSFL